MSKWHGINCSQEGCPNAAQVKGMCKRHYANSYRSKRRIGGSNSLVVRPVVDDDWKAAERAVATWLTRNGVKNTIQRNCSNFDILCENGARIEVKWCAGIVESDRIHWQVNFHRHGKLSNENTDFYVLRLGGYPALGLGATFHVVLPSPVEVKTLGITPRTLITTWGKYVEAVDLVKNFVASEGRAEAAALAMLISRGKQVQAQVQ